MTKVDLTQAESHFAFGRNWASYADGVGEAEIEEAVSGLRRLLGVESLAGRSFLDIGSGSGLHSLAAARLGAAQILALDIDDDSVATTRAILSKHAGSVPWQAKKCSVFDLRAAHPETYDVVYSWGVLHHTGDMHRAIRIAASACKDGGLFVVALYREVLMDPFWRWEKRWYANASPEGQRRARGAYRALFRSAMFVSGRSFKEYVDGYRSNRGMDFEHDVHDWMGGWPYESIGPRAFGEIMGGEGFRLEREFVSRGGVFSLHTGIFGSGCDEFVFRKA